MTLQRVFGSVGSFPDRVQMRDVPVQVVAMCDYTMSAPSDPNQLQMVMTANVTRAVREVILRRMGTGEITFRHLGTGDTAAMVPEIIGAAGLAQYGVNINSIAMSFGIDGHAPPPLPGEGGMQQQAPQQQAQPQHDVGKGTFDLGGGAQLRVKINGMSPENYAKNKASQMIWGWIIGAIIIVTMLLVGLGFGVYVWMQAKDSGSSATNAAAAAAASWDGKSEFNCGGNDNVTLSGVKATAGVNAGGNCQLKLTGVTIAAPVPIQAGANAKITMTGGSINGSTNSVVALGNSKVDLVGVAVTGKVKSLGGAKVTGAPQ
jgi:hypothetical protein